MAFRSGRSRSPWYAIVADRRPNSSDLLSRPRSARNRLLDHGRWQSCSQASQGRSWTSRPSNWRKSRPTSVRLLLGRPVWKRSLIRPVTLDESGTAARVGASLGAARHASL
eukprot:scaffold6847_cov64-Phaeocystis_antarctica.AAC.10